MFDTTAVDMPKARETVMLKRILEQAKEYYRDPKNCKAFEAWLKTKKSK